MIKNEGKSGRNEGKSFKVIINSRGFGGYLENLNSNFFEINIYIASVHWKNLLMRIMQL